jgi:serine/threonine protein kinase
MSRDLNEVKRVFLEALSKPNAEERRAYVTMACGDAPEMLACVLGMLEAHDRYATPIPEIPTESERAENLPTPAHLASGTVIGGRYKIIELINDGGMGSVYRATRIADVRLEVALKVIKPGLDSQHVLARFNIERQALAMMNHENIARVFDAGMTEYGRPYFVMELVKGLPLNRFCDVNKLPIAERLELFSKVCSAVQHAHQKGIIHRDLKPTNIVVGLYDNKAVPKVIDFGLAKAMHQPITDDSLHTRINTFVGTRRYAAPEQALLNNLDIDTRADVYSLGVILYELLTGDTPLANDRLEKAAQDEVQRMIREEDPPKPSDKIRSSHELPSIAALRRAEPIRLQKLVRGDLDWVVMKALEKDRDRRYGSASDLALEIERFIHGEPVEAGPPTIRYRLSKVLRRHKRKVLAAGFLAIALIMGAIVSTVGWVKANREMRRADEQTQRASQQAAITKSVNSFLMDDLLSEVDPAVQVRPERAFVSNITVKRVLDRAAEKVGSRFADRPLEEAAIRSTIGRAYTGLGDYKTARLNLERAEMLRLRQSGPNDPDRLNSLHDLGWMLFLDGQFDRAEPMLREAAELRAQNAGVSSPEACKSRYALALLLKHREKLDEAKAIFEEVLEKQKETLTLRNRDTLATQRELAGVLQEKMDFSHAEKLLLEVLENQVELLSRGNPDTLTTRNNLAALYWEMNQISDAEKLLADLVKDSEATFGSEDWRYLRYCSNYAAVLLKAEKNDQAIAIYERIVPVLKRVFGLHDSATLAAMQNYAAVLVALGKLSDAEPLLLEAYNGCRQSETLGDANSKTQRVVENIIELYGLMKNPDKVKEWTGVRDKSIKKSK